MSAANRGFWGGGGGFKIFFFGAEMSTKWCNFLALYARCPPEGSFWATLLSLSGPLNRLNAILSLLQPLDRYRATSAIGSAIRRRCLALSRVHDQVGALNRLVLNRFRGSTARSWRYSIQNTFKTSAKQKRDRGRDSQPHPRPRLNSQPQGATKHFSKAQGVPNHPPNRLVFKPPFLGKKKSRMVLQKDGVRQGNYLFLKGGFCPPRFCLLNDHCFHRVGVGVMLVMLFFSLLWS